MNKYQGVSLPKKLLNLIDENIDKSGYTNKTEFIRQAIREKMLNDTTGRLRSQIKDTYKPSLTRF